MGANDVPPIDSHKTKAAEVRKMEAPSTKKLDKLLIKGKEIAVKDGAANAVLSDQGQISRLTLPAGWSRSTEKHSLPSTANFVEFHSDKDPEVKICTYYRGHRISPAAGKKFHELLKAPAHDLDDASFSSLTEVLRDKAKPADFKTTSKKTLDINGRRVLLVEGKFNEIKQNAYALYVDAEDNGEVVQEVFYQAPEAKYGQYLKSAEAALKGIVWK